MGLRSMADVSLGAFIGSLEQALPHFVGADGFCQQLAPVLGEMRDARHRWRDLINSHCRTGVEFNRAWNILREEAIQSSQYLEHDMGGPLDVEAEGAGERRVDGSTRRIMTTWLEDTRAAVIQQALESHPEQSSRPV